MGICHIGIDPGLTGAICILDPGSNEVRFVDAPVLEVVVNKKTKHVLDAYRMVQILKEASDGRQVMVTIEKVNAMPGMGKGGERQSQMDYLGSTATSTRRDDNAGY